MVESDIRIEDGFFSYWSRRHGLSEELESILLELLIRQKDVGDTSYESCWRTLSGMLIYPDIRVQHVERLISIADHANVSEYGADRVGDQGWSFSAYDGCIQIRNGPHNVTSGCPESEMQADLIDVMLQFYQVLDSEMAK